MPFTVRANSERFEEIRDGRDYRAFATELDVHQSTLTRIVKKGAAPGPRFIAHSLHYLPYRFDDLFEMVEAPALN